jgi:hypothetical protein
VGIQRQVFRLPVRFSALKSSGLRLALGLLLVAAPAHAKKKSHPVESAASPEEAAAHDNGDEWFGGDDATSAGTYTLRTLIQTRFVRTAPDFGPGLESLMEREARWPLDWRSGRAG